MGDVLQALREKSKKRKKLLAQTVFDIQNILHHCLFQEFGKSIFSLGFQMLRI